MTELPAQYPCGRSCRPFAVSKHVRRKSSFRGAAGEASQCFAVGLHDCYGMVANSTERCWTSSIHTGAGARLAVSLVDSVGLQRLEEALHRRVIPSLGTAPRHHVPCHVLLEDTVRALSSFLLYGDTRQGQYGVTSTTSILPYRRPAIRLCRITPRFRPPAPAPDPATPAQTRTPVFPPRTGSGRPTAR